MKKFLRFLIPVGIFTLVMFAGGLIANAAKPEKPVYPTIQEVQQMIADAIAPLQTAINGLTARVTNIENNMPTPQPTPPFDMEMNITTQITRDNNPGFRYIGVTVYLTNSTQSQNSPFNANGNWAFAETNVWGVAHTPDGDVNAKIIPDWYGTNEFSILSFTMPEVGYPYGTNVPIDVYAEYGGKINQQTIYPNTN